LKRQSENNEHVWPGKNGRKKTDPTVASLNNTERLKTSWEESGRATGWTKILLQKRKLNLRKEKRGTFLGDQRSTSKNVGLERNLLGNPKGI